MSDPCGSCDKTTCRACPLWAVFECELCALDTCENCPSFKYALWVLQGLLERPALEVVFWP